MDEKKIFRSGLYSPPKEQILCLDNIVSEHFKGKLDSRPINQRSHVYITTSNKEKHHAISIGFDTEVVVDPLTSTSGSGVSEQPWGLEETTKGAINRLNDAISQAQPIPGEGSDYWAAAFENGIFEEGGLYVDRCVSIIARLPSSSQDAVAAAAALSEGVEVPKECANLSLASKRSLTGGHFIHCEYGLDPQFWHEQVCGTPRKQIMGTALACALAKFA